MQPSRTQFIFAAAAALVLAALGCDKHRTEPSVPIERKCRIAEKLTQCEVGPTLGELDAVWGGGPEVTWLHAQTGPSGVELILLTLNAEACHAQELVRWSTGLTGEPIAVRMAANGIGFVACVAGQLHESWPASCWQVSKESWLVDPEPVWYSANIVPDFEVVATADGMAAVIFRPGGRVVERVPLQVGETGGKSVRAIRIEEPGPSDPALLGFVSMAVVEGVVWAWSTQGMIESEGSGNRASKSVCST